MVPKAIIVNRSMEFVHVNQISVAISVIDVQMVIIIIPNVHHVNVMSLVQLVKYVILKMVNVNVVANLMDNNVKNVKMDTTIIQSVHVS